MKYIKLFENFEVDIEFDIEELEDLLISMSDYYKNLDVFKSKLRDISTSGDIRVKYNRLELMFEIK